MKKWLLMLVLFALPTWCAAQTYDFGIAVGTDDGRVYKNSDDFGTNYPPTGTAVADTTTIFDGAQRTGPSGSYTVQVGEVRWNTGPILSGQTVVSGSVVIFLTNNDITDSGLSFNGAWVTDGAIVAADYTEAGSTATTAFSVLVSDLCVSGTCTYCVSGLCTIPTSNVSSISTTPGTYTKIRFTVSQRTADAAPTGTNRILAESFEHSSPHQSPAGPHLVVMYGNTPTPSFTATVTATPTLTNTPTSATTPTRLPTNTPLPGGTPSFTSVPNCGEASTPVP